MLNGKQIAILSTNSLMSIGLKTILNDFFSPDAISIIQEYNQFFEEETTTPFDFVFIHPETYVLYNEQFRSIKMRVIVLTQKNELSPITQNFSLCTIDINQPVSEIVHQLEKKFLSKIKQKTTENQEALSIREIDVLKLVATGLMNKQIADSLCISSHTVISHRKNITRKLGINTVSGLTVYALINGMITADDLQSLNTL
jgi:DNA-binding CsgD family transcriptional regulator